MLNVTATELPRVLACSGSKKIGTSLPEYEPERNQIAEEGNAVHWAAQQVFEGKITLEELVDRKTPNGIYFTSTMFDHIEEYLNQLGGVGSMETDYQYSGQGFVVRGRSDWKHYDIAHNTLHIADLKYGWRIVEVEDNWTLISHAVGECLTQNIQPATITFSIFQPRPFHIGGSFRSVTISYEHLMKLCAEIFSKLSNPSYDLTTGEHCYRCPVAAACEALRQSTLTSIDHSMVAFEDTIDNDRLSVELDEINAAERVLKNRKRALEELATHRVKNSEKVNNYIVDIQKGNLEWKDGITSEVVKMITGFDVSKTDMITPTQASSRFGISDEVMKTLAHRRDKGFKVKRVDINKQAQKLFGK